MGRLNWIRASVPGRVVDKFMRDDGSELAVIVAWNALLAMFPIILIAAAVLGYVLRSHGAGAERIYDDFAAIVPDDHARGQLVGALQDHAGAISLLAAVTLMLSGSALFGAMDRAFARVYATRPRGFLPQRLMSFAMILVFTALAGLALGSSALLSGVPRLLPYAPRGLIANPAILTAIHAVLGVIDGTVLFGTIYVVVPNRRMRLRQALPGALVAGVLFEAITLLFPLYLEVNRNINAYGATFGLMFLLMFYFYVLGLIIMLGVETNSVIASSSAPTRR